MERDSKTLNVTRRKISREVSINGKWFKYDICSPDKKVYSNTFKKTYLGQASSYKINGIEQQLGETHHFWIL